MSTEAASRPAGIGTQGRRRGAPTELVVRRAAAFLVAFTVPLYYAIEGGSYDTVTRHEEALALWLVLELCFAFGLLPRARISRPAMVALGAIAAFALLTLLSLTWTESDGRTTEELARVVHYGGIVLLCLAALNRYTWRAAAAGLIAVGLAVCAAAVAARLVPGSLPDPTAALFDSKRLSYPLDYWNATAAWGAMSISGALAWSAHARREWHRAATLAMVPVAGLVVYLSYSRAGVAGTALGVGLVLVLSRNRWTAFAHVIVAAAATAVVILVAREHPQIAEGLEVVSGHTAEGAGALIGALLAAAACCAAVAFGVAAAGMDRIRMARQPARVSAAIGAVALILVTLSVARDPISTAWDQFQHQTTYTVGSDPAARLSTLGGTRSDVWNSAIDAYESHPLTGIGPGTFEFWWSRHDTIGEFLRDAHSLYIEQLAELGIPGLLVILVLLGALLWAGLRTRIRARRTVDAGASAAMLSMFGVYLFHAGVDWMWELTAVTVLGLAAAAVTAAGNSHRGHASLSSPAYAGVVVLCLLAVAVQVPGLVSTARTRESETTMDSGDLSKARELADQAIDAEPWSAEAYMQRAAVLEAQRHLGDAHDDLLSAIEREPTNWRPRILLAQVQLEEGNIAGARVAFANAKRLHPESFLYSTFPVFRLQILGNS